jgi:hypothetical protein
MKTVYKYILDKQENMMGLLYTLRRLSTVEMQVYLMHWSNHKKDFYFSLSLSLFFFGFGGSALIHLQHAIYIRETNLETRNEQQKPTAVA